MNHQKSTQTRDSKTEKVKVELLYRDTGNWKKYFDWEVHAPVEIGDEIKMGEKGTPDEETFFMDIWPHKWDPKSDHNLLDVVEIIE